MRFGKEFLQVVIMTTMRRCASTEVTVQRYTDRESRVGGWPRRLGTRYIGMRYVSRAVRDTVDSGRAGGLSLNLCGS